MARPKIGEKRKVSLTLSEPDWVQIDCLIENGTVPSVPEYFRQLHYGYQNSKFITTAGWSNQACIGYAIMAAEELGLDEKTIKKLVAAINWKHDMKTLDEAKKAYTESPY